MRRSHHVRGGALPETALTMSMVLLVFLGLIKVAFVGYEQSESDAVAFVAAHAASMIAGGGSQNNHAKQKVQESFPKFPVKNLSVATSAPGVGPNANGDVVGYAYRTAGGLFTNQSFGGSVFNLHSHFVEPTVTATTVLGSNLIVLVANPPNCTTNNKATPSCSGVTLASPDTKKSSDPYFPYACHAAYFAVLSNSSGFAPDPNQYFAPRLQDLNAQYGAINYVLPDSASLSMLTDENGNTLASHPWPLDFQPTATDGINNSSVRSGGWWLTPQTESNGTSDPANQDGQAVGGLIGTALTPIFDFGGANSKC